MLVIILKNPVAALLSNDLKMAIVLVVEGIQALSRNSKKAAAAK